MLDKESLEYKYGEACFKIVRLEREISVLKAKLEAMGKPEVVPDKMGPLPDYGDHMTLEEFTRGVKSGCLTDDDGCGNYASATEISNVNVDMWAIGNDKPDPRFTHVVWFNK
jgi:hypothetical protein